MFPISMIALITLGKWGLCRYFRSQHELKLPNIQNFYYILPVGKKSYVQKSHFQFAKINTKLNQKP